MKRGLQMGLLVLAAVLCLGTSKRLLGKKLIEPLVTRPPGVTLTEPPRALLKENVNNQGCFAKQRIDFSLDARIRNDSNAPLKVHPDWVRLEIGFKKKQKKFRVSTARFLEKRGPKRWEDSKTIAPKGVGSLLVRATSILSKKQASSVRWVRLTVGLQGPTKRLVLQWRGVDKLKTENVR